MNKMTKCPTCGAEIAKDAKTCVSCGAKIKKPIYKKWWFWVIAAIVIISIGSSGSGGKDGKNNDSKATSQSVTAQKKEEPKLLAVGDRATTKKFDIAVTNVETKDRVGSEYVNSTPAEGGIYVAVIFEYKNITDKPISSFSCPTIRLKDKNGTKYDSDISASTYYATEVDRDSKVLSDLNPGICVKDAKVFEISKEAYEKGGFVLIVDADQDIEYSIN